MTLQPHQWIIGCVLAFILAGASYRLRLLTLSGAAAAWIVGALIFGCGGWTAGGALLVFFTTSNLLGRFRRRQKEDLGFEKGGRRDAGQVLANGGVAAAFGFASAALPAYHSALLTASFAAIAEANADTWATEVGAAVGRFPRMITSGKPASLGMSGAVTIQGTAASAIGSAFIALFAWPATDFIALIAAAGFAGSLFDSLLGATVQAQFVSQDGNLREKEVPGSHLTRGIKGVNNDVVNALSTLFSAVLAVMLILRARLPGLF